MALQTPDTIPFGAPPISAPQQSSPAAQPQSIPFGSPPIATPTNTPLTGFSLPSVSGQESALNQFGTSGRNNWAITGQWALNALSAIEGQADNVALTPLQLIQKATGLKVAPSSTTGGNLLNGQPVSSAITDLSGQGLTEKAADAANVGLLALAPAATGALKLAGIGAASGYAQSVAAGGSTNPLDPETFKNIATGTVFAGTLGLLGNVARTIVTAEKAASGVDEGIAYSLKKGGPNLVGNYIDTALNSSKNYEGAPTVADTLNEDLQKGASYLEDEISKAGKAVGAARSDAADMPLATATAQGLKYGEDAVSTVQDEVNNLMQQSMGHQFSSYAQDSEPFTVKAGPGEVLAPTTGLDASSEGISQLPGRVAAELEPAEQKTLTWLSRQFSILKDSPDVQTASDVVNNLDKRIDWEKLQKYGSNSSPVDSILQRARGLINHNLIRPAAGALADANDTFSGLMRVKGALVDGAGQDLQHLDLLARRTLYSGQSGNAKSILDQLYDAVKSHLPTDEPTYTTKAVVARYARDMFEGITGKSGAKQSFGTNDVASLAGYTARATNAALRFVKGMIAPNEHEYAMSIAKGEPYSFIPFMHNIDKFLDSDSGSAIVNDFKSEMENWGVSSKNVGDAAVNTLKIMLLNQLTRPNGTGTPSLSTPQISQPNQSQQSSSAPTPLTMNTTNKTSQAVRSLSTPKTGQAMARTLGNFTPANINMGSGLS